MTTNETILIFVIIVALFIVVFGTLTIISTYPPRKFINIIHKKPTKNIDVFYFYYQKATAYRMLFVVHTLFSNIIKIIGSVTTFVTVYCAIDRNDYILICSLISAMCQVVGLLVPNDKYIKIYVQAARVLEYELNKDYDNQDELKKKLAEAYEKAEDIIQKEFV